MTVVVEVKNNVLRVVTVDEVVTVEVDKLIPVELEHVTKAYETSWK